MKNVKQILKPLSILLLGIVVAFSLFSITPVVHNELAFAAQSTDQSSSTNPDFGHGALPNESQASSARELISIIVNIMLGLATTVAVIFIIIGGYQYIGSGASEDMKTKAKKTLTWAISGLVVIILAAVLVNTLIGVLN